MQKTNGNIDDERSLRFRRRISATPSNVLVASDILIEKSSSEEQSATSLKQMLAWFPRSSKTDALNCVSVNTSTKSYPLHPRLETQRRRKRRASFSDAKHIKKTSTPLTLPFLQRHYSTSKMNFELANNAVGCLVILNRPLFITSIKASPNVHNSYNTVLYSEPPLSDAAQLVWLWQVIKKDFSSGSEMEQQFEPLWQRATVAVFLAHFNTLARYKHALELQKRALKAAVKNQFKCYLIPIWDKSSTHFILSRYDICKWIQSSSMRNIYAEDQVTDSFSHKIITPRARTLVQRWLIVRSAFYTLYPLQQIIPDDVMCLFVNIFAFDKAWSDLDNIFDSQLMVIDWIKAFFLKDDYTALPKVTISTSTSALEINSQKSKKTVTLNTSLSKKLLANQWQVESLLLGDKQSDEKISTVAGGTTKAAVLIRSLEKKNGQFDGYCVLTHAQIASRLRNEQMGRIARLTTQRWERVVFMFDHFVFSAFDPVTFFSSEQVYEETKARFVHILTRNNAYDATAFEVSNLGIAQFPDAVRTYLEQKSEGMVLGNCYSKTLKHDILPMNRTLKALRQDVEDATAMFEIESQARLYSKSGFVTMDVIANTVLEQEAFWVSLKDDERETASLMASVLGVILEGVYSRVIGKLSQDNQAGQIMDIADIQSTGRLFVPKEKYALIAIMLEQVLTHTLDWSVGMHALQKVCQRHRKSAKRYHHTYEKVMATYQIHITEGNADKIKESRLCLQEIQVFDIALQHTCVGEYRQTAPMLFDAVSDAMEHGVEQWLQRENYIHWQSHHLQEVFAAMVDQLLKNKEDEVADFSYRRHLISRLMILHTYVSPCLDELVQYWYKDIELQIADLSEEWRTLLSLPDRAFLKWNESTASFVIQAAACEQFTALINQSILAQSMQQKNTLIEERLLLQTTFPLQEKQHICRQTRSERDFSIRNYSSWDVIQCPQMYTKESIAFPLLVIGSGQSFRFMKVLIKQLNAIEKHLKIYPLDWSCLATLILSYQNESLISELGTESKLKHYLLEEQKKFQRGAVNRQYSPSEIAQKREKQVAGYIENCALDSGAFQQYFFTALPMRALRERTLQGKRQERMLKAAIESENTMLLYTLFEKKEFSNLLRELREGDFQRALWLNNFQYNVLESIAFTKEHIQISKDSFERVERTKHAMAKWERPIISAAMLPMLVRCRQQAWLAEWEQAWFELHRKLAMYVTANIASQIRQESRMEICNKKYDWQALYQVLFSPLIKNVQNKYHPYHYEIERFPEPMVMNYKSDIKHHQLLSWMRKKIKEKDNAALEGKKAINVAIKKKKIQGYHRVGKAIQQVLKRVLPEMERNQRVQWVLAITKEMESLCQEKLLSQDTRCVYGNVLLGGALIQKDILIAHELLIRYEDATVLMRGFIETTKASPDVLKTKDNFIRAFTMNFEKWLIERSADHKTLSGSVSNLNYGFETESFSVIVPWK